MATQLEFRNVHSVNWPSRPRGADCVMQAAGTWSMAPASPPGREDALSAAGRQGTPTQRGPRPRQRLSTLPSSLRAIIRSVFLRSEAGSAGTFTPVTGDVFDLRPLVDALQDSVLPGGSRLFAEFLGKMRRKFPAGRKRKWTLPTMERIRSFNPVGTPCLRIGRGACLMQQIFPDQSCR